MNRSRESGRRTRVCLNCVNALYVRKAIGFIMISENFGRSLTSFPGSSPFLRWRCYSDMGIPIPKTLVILQGMPISLGFRERGCPYHCDSAFCRRVGEREDPGDDDDPQAFLNALLSTTRLPRKINVVQPADLSNKHPGCPLLQY